MKDEVSEIDRWAKKRGGALSKTFDFMFKEKNSIWKTYSVWRVPYLVF